MFKKFLFLILIFFKYIYCDIELQLCVDPNCNGVISVARVESAFISEIGDSQINENNDKYLKLNAGDEINVRAKDPRDDYDDKIWFGELNGKLGYFPKNVVREIRVYTDDLKYNVPSEFVDKELPYYKEYIINNEKLYKQNNQQVENDFINHNTIINLDLINDRKHVIIDSIDESSLYLTGNSNDNVKQNPNETSVNEEEAKKLEEERLKGVEVEKKRLEEEEKRRVAEENRKKEELAKKVIEEEIKRQDEIKKAEEEKRKREEDERKAKEAEEAKRVQEEKRKQEEAENKRLELEAETKRQEEQKKAAEADRKQKEEEAKRIEEEKRKQEEEAEKKRLKEEAERKQKEEEARKAEEEKRIKDEAEKKRQEEEAEKKRKEEEAEKKRQEEEAEKKRLEEAERKQKEEAEKKRQEDIKKAQEELKQLEEQRLAAEAERKQKEEEARKAEEEKRIKDEAEKKRQEEEEAEKKRLDDIKKAQEELKQLEEQRKAAEAERKQKEEENAKLVNDKENEENDAKKAKEEDLNINNEEFEKINTKIESTNQLNTSNEDLYHYHENENQTNEIIIPNENEIINESAPGVNSINDQQQLKMKSFVYTNKYCADLNPLKEVINHIEPYYSPFVFMLPENLQMLLLESTHFLGISYLSCLLIAIMMFSSIIFWLLYFRNNDRSKMANNLKLNQAILELELTIRNLNFEKQTFIGKIIEMEKDLEETKTEKTDIDEKFQLLNEKYTKNEEQERDHIQNLTKQLTNLEIKYEQLIEKESLQENELSCLKNEKTRIEECLSKCEENIKNLIEYEKYKELEEKYNEINLDNEKLTDILTKYKVDVESFEKQVENLQHEINLRDKTIALAQNYLNNNKQNNKNLPTISENDDLNGNKIDEAVNTKVSSINNNNIDELMNIANLQTKINELEEELKNEIENKNKLNEEKKQFDLNLNNLNKSNDDLKKQLDEVLQKVKRLETENKLCEELRVKDIERNVRKEFMLEAELKKKTSDAERAAHLLEQLRLKQERIQELESQIGRMERSTTSDRHNYEKQMHENRLVARKFEKEADEAKKDAELARKEAKLWKDKYNEVEQYKEKLIRPVPNKISAFMQPIVNPQINNQFNNSNDSASGGNDMSPKSKSFHESSVERERPPSTSSNSAGYIPPMYNNNNNNNNINSNIQNNTQLPHGISPTPLSHPMYMRGLPPPPLYRPPFPPPVGAAPFLANRMMFDRNQTAPSPDMMSQYRLPNVMSPMMPPGSLPNSYPSPQQQQQQLRQTPLSILTPNGNQYSPGQQNQPFAYNNNNNNNNTDTNQQQTDSNYSTV